MTADCGGVSVKTTALLLRGWKDLSRGIVDSSAADRSERDRDSVSPSWIGRAEPGTDHDSVVRSRGLSVCARGFAARARAQCCWRSLGTCRGLVSWEEEGR